MVSANNWRNGLLWGGIFIAALLLAIGVGAMLSLVFVPSDSNGFDSDRVTYALKSAGIQAGLSVILSLCVAVPAAIAVVRRSHWWMMRPFMAAVSLAIVVPTTVAGLGLIAVWGRQGLLLQSCRAVFDICDSFTIYGLHGVVMAHMMLNIPLMMRVFIPLLHAIPERKNHLSALLSLGIWGRFVHVELPQIKPALPGVMALVFLLCFTSFALVLMLGGGPKVTTLEVEIYSAVRFDFNLGTAAGLSLIQFLCAGIIVAVMATQQQFDRPAPLSLSTVRQWRIDLGWPEMVIDISIIAVILVLIIVPIILIILNGIGADLLILLNRPQFWDSLRSSLLISSVSAVTVLGLGLVLSYGRAVLTLPHRLGRHSLARGLVVLLDGGMMLYLVIPSIVLGTAAFIILRGVGDIFRYGFAVVVLANILLALPFAVKLLDRRMASILSTQDRLATILGINGIARLRILMLPPLKNDLGTVVGLTAALSIGDLGVIALFAHPDFQTLPWLLYQLAGRYAIGEAAGLAAILLGLTVALFMLARAIVSLAIDLLFGVDNA